MRVGGKGEGSGVGLDVRYSVGWGDVEDIMGCRTTSLAELLWGCACGRE